LKKGDKGQDVEALNNILKSYGYFPESAPGNDLFDQSTEKALRKFQNERNINENGILDAATLDEIWRPQCQYSPPAPSAETHGFILWNWKWKKSNITYAIGNRLPDGPSIDDAVKFALQTWSPVTKLNFTQASDFNSADMQFSFVQLPQRKPGEVARTYHLLRSGTGDLTQTFIQVKGPGEPRWVNNFNLPNNQGTNLNAVILHEVGHGLGIAHSDQTQDLMWWLVNNNEIGLAPGDLNAARALYG